MDIQTKRQEIQALIDNIKEHSDRLKSSKSLPLEELSVVLSKITQLHEKTLILNYLAAVDQNHEEEELEISSILQKDNQLEDEEEKIDRDHSVEEDLPSIETTKFEEQSNHSSEAEERPSSDTVLHQKTESAILDFESEQELPSKPDLNEAFTEEDPSLSDQLQKQPIQDLLTAIGLNERYLYANELFNGDIEDFRMVVRRLNEFENGKAAKVYFNDELKSSYNWEEDNDMVKALYLLVERRYDQ